MLIKFIASKLQQLTHIPIFIYPLNVCFSRNSLTRSAPRLACLLRQCTIMLNIESIKIKSRENFLEP